MRSVTPAPLASDKFDRRIQPQRWSPVSGRSSKLRPRINKLSPSFMVNQFLCGIGLLLAAGISASATPAGRVVVRQEMKAAHRRDLLETLKVITGLRLSLDREGALILGVVEGPGSASARDLLTKAVNGSKFIVIKAASNRADVAFCSVVMHRAEAPTDKPISVVQIDFEDFKYLIGDERARASFNVGWGVLHEIDHVVSESEDTKVKFGAGECEENINAMRLELGLPVRATYRFSPIPAPADPAFITRLVRLGFVQEDSKRKVTKRYWLMWDASLVGGTDARSQIALSSLSH